MLRGLVADVNSDGQVNATDRSTVVGAWTGGGFTCATDINNDGQTNAIDRSMVIAVWTGGHNGAPAVKKCPPGRDCFRTAPCGSQDTRQSFADDPIPEGFFADGSEAFTGEIIFEGVPLDPATLGDADTCMLRLDPLLFQTIPSTSTTGLVIEQLHLRSASPITVTYNNGNPPELWDVDVGLSPTDAPIGSLTATKTHPNGGTFAATFFVQPLFTFVKVADPSEIRVLDTAAYGQPPVEFTAPGPEQPPGACNEPSWVQSLADDLPGILATSPCFIPGVVEIPVRGGGTFQQVSGLCHNGSCFGAACPFGNLNAHCTEPPTQPPPD